MIPKLDWRLIGARIPGRGRFNQSSVIPRVLIRAPRVGVAPVFRVGEVLPVGEVWAVIDGSEVTTLAGINLEARIRKKVSQSS